MTMSEKYIDLSSEIQRMCEDCRIAARAAINTLLGEEP